MSVLRNISVAILVGAVLTGWIYQYQLVGNTEIHWDEFYFLSKVHAYEAGWWAHTLQSMYVHFFGWLTWAGPNEVDQVIWGRSFSLVFLTSMTGLGLFFGVRRLTESTTAALAAAFLGLAHPFAAFQAFRFRVDPMLAAGFVGMAALLIVARESRIVRNAVAVIVGLMGTLSMKAIFFVPSLVILLALRTEDESWWVRVKRIFEFGWVSALSASLFLGMHHLTLAEGGVANSQVLAGRAAETMFGRYLPRRYLLEQTLQFEQVFWWPIAAGFWVSLGSLLVVVLGWSWFKASTRRAAIATLAMCIPLTFPLFYRNAFHYFYICIIPPACFGVGWLVCIVERLLKRWAPRRLRMHEWIAAAATLPLLFLVVQQMPREDPGKLKAQREFLDVVHQVFPEPVPYLDRCSMVASSRKVGPFLTTWRLRDLRAGMKPGIEDLVRSQEPVFVVNNMNGLDLSKNWKSLKKDRHRIPKTDFQFLKKHYIQHVGPLWVAGQILDTSDTLVDFSIIVEGTYTLESTHSVRIDGVERAANSTIQLSKGPHQIQAVPDTPGGTAVLRIGDHLERPTLSKPSSKLFSKRQHPVRPK